MEGQPQAMSWFSGRAGLCVALLLVISGLVPSAGSAANPTKVEYDVTVIPDFSAPPPPGGLPAPPQGSGAFGLNEAGDVVGWSTYTAADSSVSALLFLYKDGQVIRLGQLPGGWNSWGYAINDSGVVVGVSTVMAMVLGYPFVWQAGAMTNLLAGIPACAASVFNCGGGAFDVNSAGDIVGERVINSSGVCCAPLLAFLYSQGSFTDLVLPGDTGSVATAINEHGDVVGSSSPSGAFLYHGGTMMGLDALGCTGCAPTDISDNRKVVGSTALASGERHAFVWSDGAMHDLGTLGGTSSEATAVNRTGNTVVGNATTASGEGHGFVYRGGKMVDLNELIDPEVGTIIEAQDVNNHGQIAGRISVRTSFLGPPPGTRLNTYAVLLTPRK